MHLFDFLATLSANSKPLDATALCQYIDHTDENSYVLNVFGNAQVNLVSIDWDDLEKNRTMFLATARRAAFYAQEVMQSAWESAEDVICEEPVAAETYARRVLQARWPKAEAIIATHSGAATRYVLNHLNDQRWAQAEPAILSDAESASNYATYVIKARWPEAEALIASHASAALHYARSVLKCRWKGAEPALVKHAQLAADYAEFVLKTPWPEAESAIAADPIAAAQYATRVLKSTWPEAENIIATNATAACSYAIHSLGTRWTEAESVIAKDAVAACDYAAFLIAGPWPEAESAIADGAGTQRALFKATAAQEYADIAKKGRWPEAEHTIRQNPGGALLYAQYTLKRRWPEAEPIIAASPLWSDDYIRNVFCKSENWESALAGYNQLRSNYRLPNYDISVVQSWQFQNWIDTLDEPLRGAMVELNQLIGLDEVKSEIRKLVALSKMHAKRRDAGRKVASTTLHLVFTGNPGTGKTTVARIVGQIYSALNLLDRGHVVEVLRHDLVGQFVGQTAPQTAAKLDEALDGVFFLDEAYSLTDSDSTNDFGGEAVNTILAYMENHRDRVCVIAAGYKDEMKKFIDSNPGLRSRFTRYIHFEDYSPKEMVRMFEKMAANSDYAVSDALKRKLHSDLELVVSRKTTSGFGNGRFVRGLLESTIESHALRVTESNCEYDMDLLDEGDLPPV